MLWSPVRAARGAGSKHLLRTDHQGMDKGRIDGELAAYEHVFDAPQRVEDLGLRRHGRICSMRTHCPPLDRLEDTAEHALCADLGL